MCVPCQFSTVNSVIELFKISFYYEAAQHFTSFFFFASNFGSVATGTLPYWRNMANIEKNVYLPRDGKYIHKTRYTAQMFKDQGELSV